MCINDPKMSRKKYIYNDPKINKLCSQIISTMIYFSSLINSFLPVKSNYRALPMKEMLYNTCSMKALSGDTEGLAEQGSTNELTSPS